MHADAAMQWALPQYLVQHVGVMQLCRAGCSRLMPSQYILSTTVAPGLACSYAQKQHGCQDECQVEIYKRVFMIIRVALRAAIYEAC